MEKWIDINCDLGEGHDDRAIMPYISSCNIACGGHIGDAKTVAQTLDFAQEFELAIGAHPSYPDRENFGRVNIHIPLYDLIESISSQIQLVHQLCKRKGLSLHHVKPHGALYIDMAKDKILAATILKKIKTIAPHAAVYLLAGSAAVEVAEDLKMAVYNEGFADRTYENNVALRSRKLPGSLLSDKQKITDQIDNFLDNTIIDFNGHRHAIKVDTICLHSDTPSAITLASDIYNHLKQKHVRITANK